MSTTDQDSETQEPQESNAAIYKEVRRAAAAMDRPSCARATKSDFTIRADKGAGDEKHSRPDDVLPHRAGMEVPTITRHGSFRQYQAPYQSNIASSRPATAEKNLNEGRVPGSEEDDNKGITNLSPLPAGITKRRESNSAPRIWPDLFPKDLEDGNTQEALDHSCFHCFIAKENNLLQPVGCLHRFTTNIVKDSCRPGASETQFQCRNEHHAHASAGEQTVNTDQSRGIAKPRPARPPRIIPTCTTPDLLQQINFFLDPYSRANQSNRRRVQFQGPGSLGSTDVSDRTRIKQPRPANMTRRTGVQLGFFPLGPPDPIPLIRETDRSPKPFASPFESSDHRPSEVADSAKSDAGKKQLTIYKLQVKSEALGMDGKPARLLPGFAIPARTVTETGGTAGISVPSSDQLDADALEAAIIQAFEEDDPLVTMHEFPESMERLHVPTKDRAPETPNTDQVKANNTDKEMDELQEKVEDLRLGSNEPFPPTGFPKPSSPVTEAAEKVKPWNMIGFPMRPLHECNEFSLGSMVTQVPRHITPPSQELQKKARPLSGLPYRPMGGFDPMTLPNKLATAVNDLRREFDMKLSELERRLEHEEWQAERKHTEEILELRKRLKDTEELKDNFRDLAMAMKAAFEKSEEDKDILQKRVEELEKMLARDE